MTPEHRVAIGIDGGGTSTRAVIVGTDGAQLGSGSGGPSNYQAVGIERCHQSILEAIESAWKDSALPRRPADSIFLGMAGVVSEFDRGVIRDIVSRIEPDAIVEVDHDLRPALASGVGSGEGIVLIAGTGSSCYGRNADGKSWRSGGWGHLLDDNGGGYRLGLDGLVAVVRAADGRAPATSLASTLPAALGIDAIDDILHAVHHRSSRSDIAALAPLVLHAAEQGDTVATSIVEQGAHELALMVRAVDAALQWESRPVAVVCSGSLFRNAYYRKVVESEVARQVDGVRLIEPEITPAMAGARLALEVLNRAQSIYHKDTKDTKEHKEDQ